MNAVLFSLLTPAAGGIPPTRAIAPPLIVDFLRALIRPGDLAG